MHFSFHIGTLKALSSGVCYLHVWSNVGLARARALVVDLGAGTVKCPLPVLQVLFIGRKFV